MLSFLKSRLSSRTPRPNNCVFGPHTYGNPNILSWGENTTLVVGAYCSIAEGVEIFLGGEHRIDWISTYPFTALWSSAKSIKGHPTSKGGVKIGNDVWIGWGATILSGVEIGDGAVIGARSVVSRNVAPYSIVAGNPAKEVRKRFPDADIAKLLKIQWWTLSDADVNEILPMLCSSRIDELWSYYNEKKEAGR